MENNKRPRAIMLRKPHHLAGRKLWRYDGAPYALNLSTSVIITVNTGDYRGLGVCIPQGFLDENPLLWVESSEPEPGITMNTLQKRVDQELDAAVFENGYTELMDRTPEEVAIDLCTYSSELETVAWEDVEPCVKDYQAWYRNRTTQNPRSQEEPK